MIFHSLHGSLHAPVLKNSMYACATTCAGLYGDCAISTIYTAVSIFSSRSSISSASSYCCSCHHHYFLDLLERLRHNVRTDGLEFI